MKVFALVDVSYDYFRFESLQGIGVDKDKLLEQFNKHNLDVLEYNIDMCPEGIGAKEYCHIWIYEVEI